MNAYNEPEDTKLNTNPGCAEVADPVTSSLIKECTFFVFLALLRGPNLYNPSKVQDPDVSKPSLLYEEIPFINGPTAFGYPGSTLDAERNGVRSKEDVWKSAKPRTSLLISRQDPSCLFDGPPNSLILIELSGSIPTERRKDLMLCCVPFERKMSGMFTNTRRSICDCTYFRDTSFRFIPLMFSASEY
jgi:hypothetical protein